jgi:hypothetical protein
MSCLINYLFNTFHGTAQSYVSNQLVLAMLLLLKYECEQEVLYSMKMCIEQRINEEVYVFDVLRFSLRGYNVQTTCIITFRAMLTYILHSPCNSRTPLCLNNLFVLINILNLNYLKKLIYIVA